MCNNFFKKIIKKMGESKENGVNKKRKEVFTIVYKNKIIMWTILDRNMRNKPLKKGKSRYRKEKIRE